MVAFFFDGLRVKFVEKIAKLPRVNVCRFWRDLGHDHRRLSTQPGRTALMVIALDGHEELTQ